MLRVTAASAYIEVERDNTAGNFWLDFGILSLGLERLGDETEWKMINGRNWYQELLTESWISKTGEAIEPVVKSKDSK